MGFGLAPLLPPTPSSAECFAFASACSRSCPRFRRSCICTKTATISKTAYAPLSRLLTVPHPSSVPSFTTMCPVLAQRALRNKLSITMERDGKRADPGSDPVVAAYRERVALFADALKPLLLAAQNDKPPSLQVVCYVGL